MANPDPGRTARDICQEGLGHAHMGVIGQRGMLHRPDDIEAHFLGQYRLLDHILEHAAVAGARRIGRLCFINEGKAHRS